jgi:chorismate synthase
MEKTWDGNNLAQHFNTMGNTFGKMFQIATWGESHGPGVGVVIDGCPPGIAISLEEIQRDLDRRRPGQSRLTTQRREADRVELLSGIFEGRTMGTPIALLVRNEDARPEAYQHLKDLYRPSHADFTYLAKFGVRDWRGGGRSSARETLGRVAAGAIARKVLAEWAGVEIVAYVRQVHTLVARVDPSRVRARDVESNPVRCPDAAAAKAMAARIEAVRRSGDSVGGVIELVLRNVPPGLGEPVFDRLEADLAKAMLSLPATKGFEVGSGFGGTLLTGSRHNDAYYMARSRVRTRTNRSGGIQGGISDGEDIFCRIAFKPTATINKPQRTVTENGRSVILRARGRHDPCVLPRAVVMVEAMAALVLADHLLRQRGQCGLALPAKARRPARGARGRAARAARPLR